MSRRHRHLQRIGRSSGFAVHYRNLGVRQEIMDRWIQGYYRHHGDLLRQVMRGPEFNALMGIEAIARGDYRPDRTHSLAGAAAYDREKKKYMKDLGLARKDDAITEKMAQYIRILEQGGDLIRFLREQAIKIKLFCPQTNVANWSPRQNGYAHYRIRPLVMLLYAVQTGNELGIEINTDDIVLSAFRFFTPREQALIDEEFMMEYIREYMERKLRGEIDYQREFESMMQRVETDLREDLRSQDSHAFARKCRNAANEAYCAIIFVRFLGWVNAPKGARPGHWSATQQAYGDTPVVPEYNILTLTEAGETALNDALGIAPIWYKDIEAIFGQRCFREIEIINRLALTGEYRGELSESQIQGLQALGIELISDDGAFRAIRPPVFDLQYDMP